MRYFIPQINYERRPTLLESRIAEIFDKKYLSGGGVLDIGCGYGKSMEVLKRLGRDVIGIDHDDDAERVCRGKGLNFFRCDVENEELPFNDSIIDNIVCSHFLEHLRNVPGFIEKCHRILKVGGRIIIVSPDWKHCYRKYWDDPTHHTPVTRPMLERILIGTRFDIIESSPFRKPGWLKLLWKKFDFPFYMSNEYLLCVGEKGG